MDTRALGRQGLGVSAIGLGCMPMSHGYGSADSRDPAEALATLAAAVDSGVTFFDTAEVYGPWTNEELLGTFLKGRREPVVIATKFGFRLGSDGKADGLDGSPENARRACEGSLKRLGIDCIDLFYLHRRDPAVPIEDSVGAMAGLVQAGKVRYLGLSEVGAETLRRAASVHPISALQSEYSLWERGIERDVLPACRELGIGLVPYAPLGRGVLTNTTAPPAEYAANGDFRATLPRFQGENLAHNRALGETLARFAGRLRVTPGQLALAWLLAQGPDIVPIPGTRRRTHLAENAAAASVKLASCDLMALEEMFPRGAAVGPRYEGAAATWIDR
jgi:aryl-alcohol dehydrogenase-like predicted oxidoreductase